MRIIDDFIFLAEHEKEIILAKMLCGNNYIDEWIITENQYDYRGRFKGAKAQTMIDNDQRFAPFRDRITVLSIDKPFFNFVDGLETNYDPIEFAESEWRLREHCKNYILGKYNNNDLVIISDADEVIDFTTESRKKKFFDSMSKSDVVSFERIRYWWDFDNRSWRLPYCIITDCVSVGAVKSGDATLRDRKNPKAIRIPNGNCPNIFEYSFCFDKEASWYKLSTSLHTNWSRENFDDSIKYNFWTRRNDELVDINNRYLWFEKTELTENNSPGYIRENLPTLKTNLVPKNYTSLRMLKFGSKCQFKENNIEEFNDV